MASFTIPLPCKPVTGNSRVHWRERHRVTQSIRLTSAICATSARNKMQLMPAREKCQLLLVLLRGKGERLLDWDQVYAALKPVVDGLRDARWIVDDSPKWLEYSAAQAKDNDAGPAVVVDVRPVTAAVHAH